MAVELICWGSVGATDYGEVIQAPLGPELSHKSLNTGETSGPIDGHTQVVELVALGSNHRILVNTYSGDLRLGIPCFQNTPRFLLVPEGATITVKAF